MHDCNPDSTERGVFFFKGGYPARLKNVFIISPPLWFRAFLTFFLNFLQEKLKERIEVVPKETLLQRFPESSIPESFGGTLKVDHLAWLNNCLMSYSETLAERNNCNGAVNDSIKRYSNKDLCKGDSSAFGQETGLRNEGALTVMEFMEHMMKLTRKGIQNEFVNVRRQTGTGNFQSARQVYEINHDSFVLE